MILLRFVFYSPPPQCISDCNFVVEQMSRCLNASKLDPAVGSFPSSPPSQSCARILTLPPLEQGLALFNITASQITHMFVCDGINLADRLAAHVGAVLGSLAVDGPYSSTADRNLAIQVSWMIYNYLIIAFIILILHYSSFGFSRHS